MITNNSQWSLVFILNWLVFWIRNSLYIHNHPDLKLLLKFIETKTILTDCMHEGTKVAEDHSDNNAKLHQLSLQCAADQGYLLEINSIKSDMNRLRLFH